MHALTTFNQLIRREQYMLSQFRNSLQATIDRVVEINPAHKEALTAFTERLANETPLSWSMVNQIELALVDYYDEINLETEWQRQLANIQRLPNHLANFYQQQDHQKIEGSQAIEKRRALLSSLIKDMQWVRESKRVIRYTENQMRRKTVALFLLSFVLFFSPTIHRLFFDFQFDNLRLYYIFTAATSGILGAAFSQLTSIQSRVLDATLDQVQAMSQIGYITARSMVGAGAGLIMFYLLQSGLLDGAFFPQFIHSAAELETVRSELSLSGSEILSNRNAVSQNIESSVAVGTLAQPAQGLSLLIVWCIIAGFSEKMIPGILNKKANEAKESA